MRINWIETHLGNFKADVGNYIRLELQKNSKSVWNLYLSIRVFKVDGANCGTYLSRVCKSVKVAKVGKDDVELAKTNSENWYRDFVKDQVHCGEFGIIELL